MLVRQGFKYRVEPMDAQLQQLERTASICRYIWNSALALQIHRLERHGRILSYEELAAELREAKKTEGLEFLKQAHSQAEQQKLMDLSQAFKDFFAGEKGFARFKKKGRYDSFRQPQSIRVEGRHVQAPKLGKIRFRKRGTEILPPLLNSSRASGSVPTASG